MRHLDDEFGTKPNFGGKCEECAIVPSRLGKIIFKITNMWHTSVVVKHKKEIEHCLGNNAIIIVRFLPLISNRSE